MSIKLRAGSGGDVLQPGTYDAVVTRIEEASNSKGQYLRWSFSTSPHGEEKTITGVSAMNIDPGSRTLAWVENILGRAIAPNEEIDLERLVGRACKLDLSNATLDDGRRVVRVERVLKKGLVMQSRPAAPPVPSPESFDEPAF